MWWDRGRKRISPREMLSVAAKTVTPFIVATIVGMGPKIITSIKTAVCSLTTTMKMVLAKINLPLIYQDLIISLVIIGMLLAIAAVINFIDFTYRHHRPQQSYTNGRS